MFTNSNRSETLSPLFLLPNIMFNSIEEIVEINENKRKISHEKYRVENLKRKKKQKKKGSLSLIGKK